MLVVTLLWVFSTPSPMVKHTSLAKLALEVSRTNEEAASGLTEDQRIIKAREIDPLQMATPGRLMLCLDW